MALPNKTKIPVGTVLAGKYRITREIGRGGMATVHEAENVDIGKRVAIKVLAQELTGSSIVVERFLREARAAAAIRSPYICDVYDSGKLKDTGQPFLVLELLEGESLYERMTRQRQLDIATTVSVISQVCRGLTKAHVASIVHRDLKPENIFLTKDEDGQLLAKILDFGLAKFYTPTSKDQTRLTRDGAVFGTPAYMSPEQVRGQGAVDHRADLWALGCITYECFTGKTVWSTDQGVAMTFAQIASAPLPRPARYRPDLAQGFTDWFDRSLDRDINRRFQTAKEFAEALAASFGLERRETSEIRQSPIEARAEAAAALAAAQAQGAASAPPSPRAQQPPPPSSGRAQQQQHHAQASQQPAEQHSPEPSVADHYRPITGSDEDLDPTRVLSKQQPFTRGGGAGHPGAQGAAQHTARPLESGRPGPPDGKLERFRRTPDGKIAKVVPQVVPNAPNIPSGPRPPPPTPVPGSHRAPAGHGHGPAQGHAQSSQQAHHGQHGQQGQHGPHAGRSRPTPVPPAASEHDSEILKNPFAKARRRRNLVLGLTLGGLAIVAVILIAISSSPPERSGTSDTTTPSTDPSGAAPVAQSVSATTSAAPSPPATSAAPLPAWLADVRDAQSSLAAGDPKGAGAKLSQAATRSSQHGAAQGLARQVSSAVYNRGTCALAGVARPRTYDLADASARRFAATRPSIVAAGVGALVAWTDAHTGIGRAYVAPIDGAFALAGGAIDLSPDGADVRSVELYAWGDRVIALYTDAKAGTFARFVGADGKPAGAPVQVGPPKSAQAVPAIVGAQGRALYVAWTDDGDRDSEDLFLQKLSMVTLAPEGNPSRATDLVPLVPTSSQRARALAPRGTVAKDALRIVFEMERKPASFIELITVGFGDVGRDLTSTGTNREGKTAGTVTLVNVDKSRAHAPQIACSAELCFVVWHGESPPGAQGAALDLATGKALWRRKFSPNAHYPAVAAGPSGAAAAAWIEDGKLVASPLGRAGFGRTARVGRAQASQPVVALVPGAEKGLYLAAWLDMEGTLPEPYVARLRCP